MISNIRKLSVLLALSAVSLFAVTNSARAVIVGPYADGSGLHLFHINEPAGAQTDNNQTVAGPIVDTGGGTTMVMVNNFRTVIYDPPSGNTFTGTPGFANSGGIGQNDPTLGWANSSMPMSQVVGSTNGGFTLEAVIKFTDGTTGEMFRNRGTSDTSLRVVRTGAGSFDFYVPSQDNGEILSFSGFTPDTSKWYHAAWTYSGTGTKQAKMYLTEMLNSNTSAAQYGSTATGTAANSYDAFGATGFQVGNASAGVAHFLVDEVRISGSELGAGQMMFAEEQPEAVPEPSTYALGLIGLAGLGLVAWRRRRRS